jgi:hypothetical protein
MLAIEFVGHIVSDVDIAFSNHGADHVVPFIHSSAKPISVFLRWGLMFSQKGVPLKVSGWFLSG